jgi:hypothetical protein
VAPFLLGLWILASWRLPLAYAYMPLAKNTTAGTAKKRSQQDPYAMKTRLNALYALPVGPSEV